MTFKTFFEKALIFISKLLGKLLLPACIIAFVASAITGGWFFYIGMCFGFMIGFALFIGLPKQMYMFLSMSGFHKVGDILYKHEMEREEKYAKQKAKECIKKQKGKERNKSKD